MKKLTILSVALLGLFSCTGLTVDNAEVNVRKVFPKAAVYHQTGFTFLVVDSSSNQYFRVECLNMTDNSVSKIEVIGEIRK